MYNLSDHGFQVFPLRPVVVDDQDRSTHRFLPVSPIVGGGTQLQRPRAAPLIKIVPL